MKKISSPRKLTLNKEAVRKLSQEQLADVAGGLRMTQQWWCTSNPCKTDSCHFPCI